MSARSSWQTPPRSGWRRHQAGPGCARCGRHRQSAARGTDGRWTASTVSVASLGFLPAATGGAASRPPAAPRPRTAGCGPRRGAIPAACRLDCGMENIPYLTYRQEEGDVRTPRMSGAGNWRTKSEKAREGHSCEGDNTQWACPGNLIGRVRPARPRGIRMMGWDWCVEAHPHGCASVVVSAIEAPGRFSDPVGRAAASAAWGRPGPCTDASPGPSPEAPHPPRTRPDTILDQASLAQSSGSTWGRAG